MDTENGPVINELRHNYHPVRDYNNGNELNHDLFANDVPRCASKVHSCFVNCKMTDVNRKEKILQLFSVKYLATHEDLLENILKV